MSTVDLLVFNESQYKGSNKKIIGNFNIIEGSDLNIEGKANQLYVSKCTIVGNANWVVGDDNTVTGDFNTVIGNSNTVSGDSNTEYERVKFWNFSLSSLLSKFFGSASPLGRPSRNQPEEDPVVMVSNPLEIPKVEKDEPETVDEKMCTICYEFGKKCAFIDCGHQFCNRCIRKILHQETPKCPMCRVKIVKGGIRLY